MSNDLADKLDELDVVPICTDFGNALVSVAVLYLLYFLISSHVSLLLLLFGVLSLYDKTVAVSTLDTSVAVSTLGEHLTP